MIINLGEENVSNYKYKFPTGLCIYNMSIEMLGSWNNSVKIISDYIKEKLPLFDNNGNMYFWLKSDIYKKPSRLKQMKSIWNNSKLTWLSKNQCILFKHNNGDEEFYSAISALYDSQINMVLNFSRANEESFIFFANNIKDSYIDFDSYLSSNYYDVEKVVSFFYDKNVIFIRPTGNFDDKYLSIDFYGRKEVLSSLFSNVNFENL